MKHWLAERIDLVEPVRVIYGKEAADAYAKRDGGFLGRWSVTGPYVLESS